MKNIYCLILILLSSNFMLSQTVTVLDESNLQGIENVYIYNLSQSTLTNKSGKANIGLFAKNDTLIFQHPSFKTIARSYESIVNSNFVVRLSESVVDINEIVVSANRWEQKKNEVPNQISTISTKEITNSNAQTTADLLGTANGVYIQKSQMGGGSPMIRGFATNRVLIVIDGVRMNNAIYRSGNLQNVISLDANATANAEIIMGPGSVIYGSDAIGGVMDFHTLSPTLSDSSMVFKAGAMARYSTANKENTGHFRFNIGGKKWSFLSSATYSSFNDLRMGSNEHDEYTRNHYVTRIGNKDTMLVNPNRNIQKKSGYNQLNLMEKLRFQPNQNLDINYAFHYSKLSDVPRYDRLIEYSGEILKYAEWYYGPQEWIMHALKIEIKRPTGLFDGAKITAAYQDYKESRHDRKFNKVNFREQFEKVKVASITFDFDKSLNDNNSLFYGLEGVYNLVNSDAHQKSIETGATTADASRYPDGSDYQSVAAYLNFKHKINEQLSLTSGLRYNQIWLNADFDTTFYKFPFKKVNITNGALNGSLGLVFNSPKQWQFKLNGSTGFRSPNIDDIGKVFDSEPGNVVVPNPELKPEYAWNADFWIAKTINQSIQLEAGVFYTLLNNAMVRRDFLFNGQDSIMYDGELSKVQALSNASKAYVYGFQVIINAEIFKKFVFQSNLTYTKGEEQDETSGKYVPLRHASPLFGSTHLIYRTKKLSIDVYSNYNGEISNKNLAPSEQAKPDIYATDSNGNPYSPAWYTFNLKAIYQLNHYLQVNAGLENLMDLRYRPYSSGIVAPGRNFIVSLRITI